MWEIVPVDVLVNVAVSPTTVDVLSAVKFAAKVPELAGGETTMKPDFVMVLLPPEPVTLRLTV